MPLSGRGSTSAGSGQEPVEGVERCIARISLLQIMQALGIGIDGVRRNSEIAPPSSRKWPTLPDKILIKNGNSVDALQCWSGVIRLLQTFRQGKDIGRDPGNSSSRPGRSRWPEPESIRRITGDRARKYQRMEHIPDNAAFPRAEFGLPIVFNLPAQGDPGTLELYPVVGGSEKQGWRAP